MKLNLFDLNEENHNFEDKENKEKPDVNILDKFIFNIASSLMPEDMLSEEDMDKMFENIMLKVSNKDPKQKPTIDDILDKIQDNGFDSLTNFEKQILDEYSKN
jgi:FPC/CPF motif-containing protein YcgG